LTLALAVAGGWNVTTDRQAKAVRFVNSGKTLLYSGLKAWDAKGRNLPARMEAKGGQVCIQVEDRKAVYPLTVDPVILMSRQTELTANDGAQGDYFGYSVCISGNTAIMGAPDKNSNTGAAYVFVRDSQGNWSQQAELTASDGAQNAGFGGSVSISGDTAIAGAEAQNNSGATYIFVRSNGVWTQQQKLAASDGATGDWFGRSVSVNGDTAIVGAAHKNNSTGAAYIFVRSNCVWTQQQKLTASDAMPFDSFGRSVSISGDTAVVGAPDKNSNAGAAYVFIRDSQGNWSQQAKLTASDGRESDLFGVSVSNSGDTAIVGAYPKNAVYVFVRSGGVWTQQQILTASDGVVRSDNLGWSVCVSGDIVVAAAPDKNNTGTVYAFVRDSQGHWTQQAEWTANDGVTGDQFGWSVSVSGDTAIVGAAYKNNSAGAAYVLDLQQELTADDGAQGDQFGNSVSVSGDTAVVGAYSGNNGTGAAYVFVRSGGVWTQQQELSASDGAQNDFFGISVSISGDTALVGALDKNNADGSTGAAYVFVRSNGVWIQQAKLIASDGAQSDLFGRSVSVSGDTVLVGAYGKNSNTGAAYVFVRDNQGNWTQQAELAASDGGLFDEFGNSVSISGDTVLVGAPAESTGPGAAYVFVRDYQGHWIQQKELTVSEDIPQNDYFGGSVSVSGDTALVGAVGKRLSNQVSGAAYVFVRSGGVWTQQQELTASDGEFVDYFGSSVSVSGDTVVIAAPGKNHSNGAAYVFVRSNGVWTQQQELTDGAGLLGTLFGDHFGGSVSVSGDTVLVGAYGKNGTTPNNSTGAAYVQGRSVITRDDIFVVTPNTALTVGAPGVLTNDPDNSIHPLTARLVVAPTAGSLTFNRDGSFTFTPPANTYGTFRFAYQATDGTDVSDLTWVTLNVKSNTLLQLPPVSGIGGQNVLLRAAIRRYSDGAFLVGQTVRFQIDGNTVGTATTQSNFIASLNYTLPASLSPGTHTFSASFAGDSDDNASTQQAALTVHDNTLVQLPAASGIAGQSVLLRAAVRRYPDGQFVAGKTVSFQIDGNTVGSAVTQSNYIASLNYTIPAGLGPGTHTLKAVFAGDSDYNASTQTATLSVSFNTLVQLPNVSGTAGKSVLLRAAIRRYPDGQFLAGQTVTFQVDGTTVGAAVTQANFIASLNYTLPTNMSSGSHTLKAIFAGGGGYNPSSQTATLTVNP
jgi:hypothetical protein